jgi:hypothetical protein
MNSFVTAISAVTVLLWLSGCGQKPAPQNAVVHKHEHVPPHHGTPVVLGNEEYHVELVLDAAAGKLDAYVMDGELENFVRVQQPTFEVVASHQGHEDTLIFKAVPNQATGETVGDTSQFETQADWLKTEKEFDAVLKNLTVRGSKYQDIKFNFPKGNDTDEKPK